MDLSTGSLGWHRTRQWLDSEIERIASQEPVNEYHGGLIEGTYVAYVRVRSRFNTPEEEAKTEQTRREMFG